MNNIYTIDKYTTATAPIIYDRQKSNKNIFFRKTTKPIIDTIKTQFILQNIFV